MNDKSSRFWQLTELLKWTTRDIRGRPVGRVADVIVDSDEGRIAYLCIQIGNRNENHDIEITIPWSAISRISASRKDIWIAAGRETLLRLGSGPDMH